MGILGDEGEPGVEAGSEEAACRQRATKESMKMLQTEERTNERDSRGELGDMGVVAGDGAESQDQEVRAQRCRRELGEEERRHRRRTCVIYKITIFGESLLFTLLLIAAVFFLELCQRERVCPLVSRIARTSV